ncbi:lipocalin family protein [Marinifilum sp. D714]|uniref:lipocalin family protein n=1 Tax=Marinifilum sp. D714 TaxID=2937523 RepID=UPI0027C2E0CA|nr:lipocalin family protein [Marinifilum sp. D714]MDQ2180400.1 lipocalin family protein [Marinifilum sp. D714]
MKKQLNILLTSLVLLCSCKGQESVIDNSVVKDLNIDLYLGKWYEIARFDHSFERGLVGVTAHYSMREDGKIKVVNSGYKGSLDGERSEAIGKAKIPNPNLPSKLKVSFFWIFYGDYFVLELDEDYQWAIVGSNTDKYLWILSRNPQMDDELYLELLNKLKARGYDTSKLIKVEQRKK